MNNDSNKSEVQLIFRTVFHLQCPNLKSFVAQFLAKIKFRCKYEAPKSNLTKTSFGITSRN